MVRRMRRCIHLSAMLWHHISSHFLELLARLIGNLALIKFSFFLILQLCEYNESELFATMAQ